MINLYLTQFDIENNYHIHYHFKCSDWCEIKAHLRSNHFSESGIREILDCEVDKATLLNDNCHRMVVTFITN